MWELTYEDMCRKLAEKENFSFSRWGDGEWQSVFGVNGRNCDGHPFYADLSLSLASVLLQDQVGHMGMQPKAIRDMGEKIDAWCIVNGCGVEWCDADLLHEASIDDRLDELGVQLLKRKVIFVGPHRLKEIAWKFKANHVKVPLTHAWRYYRQIYGDLQDQIDKDVVVLYSMSMGTNVLINQIAREYGDVVTQISCGSLWEPYAYGGVTRKYHKKIMRRLNEDSRD
jgi:hypothetical protein